MFGASNGKDARKSSPPSTATGAFSNNSLVHGTRIEGTVFSESDIRIDGKVVGSVQSKGKVIIGPSGHIEGDIQCKNAVIEGRFEGKLIVSELLQVMEAAVVEGEVSTGKLMVQSGSMFNVACRMGAQRAREEQKQSSTAPLELEKLAKVVHQ